MRFSIFGNSGSAPDRSVASRWVNPAVAGGTPEFRAHTVLLQTLALLGSLSLLLFPVALIFADGPDPVLLAVAGFASLPLAIAYLVSRFGKLGLGQFAFFSWVAALLAGCSMVSGGVTSPFMLLFAFPPLYASLLGASTRVALLPVIAGMVSVVFVGSVDLASPIAAALAWAVSWNVPLFLSFCAGLYGWHHVRRSSAELAASLAAEKERASWFTNSVTDMVSLHDKSGAASYVSAAARDLFGTESADLLNSGMLEKVHLQDRIVFLRCISEAAHEGRPATCSYRIRTRGGPAQLWKHVETIARPKRDTETGKVVVVCATRDVTEIHERQAAFEAAQTQAESDKIARRHVLTTMAHELRTPLNSIIGFSDVLKQELFGEIKSEKNREYVDLIREAGQHLLNVTNHMLDVSRMEAGKYELSVSLFSVSEIVEPTVRMLEPLAQKNGVTLSYSETDDLPEIAADRRACRQMLINVVSNAIKFSPKGGQVSIKTMPFGRALRFKITDQGIGMSSQFLEMIGRPFTQADHGLDRSFEGTGLGLCVVKGLVDLHGGEFHVSSQEGNGTVVTITLPLKPSKPRPVPAEAGADLVTLSDQKTTGDTASSAVEESPKVSSKGDRRARLSA